MKTIRKRDKKMWRDLHTRLAFSWCSPWKKNESFGDFSESSNDSVYFNPPLIPFIMDGQQQDNVHQSDTTVSFIQGRNWMWSLETGLLTASAACLTSGAFTGQPQH